MGRTLRAGAAGTGQRHAKCVLSIWTDMDRYFRLGFGRNAIAGAWYVHGQALSAKRLVIWFAPESVLPRN